MRRASRASTRLDSRRGVQPMGGCLSVSVFSKSRQGRRRYLLRLLIISHGRHPQLLRLAVARAVHRCIPRPLHAASSCLSLAQGEPLVLSQSPRSRRPPLTRLIPYCHRNYVRRGYSIGSHRQDDRLPAGHMRKHPHCMLPYPPEVCTQHALGFESRPQP